MPRGMQTGDYPNVESDTQPRWLWYQGNSAHHLNLMLRACRSSRRLAEKADVVIESFKPLTAARLGVDDARAAIRHRHRPIARFPIRATGHIAVTSQRAPTIRRSTDWFCPESRYDETPIRYQSSSWMPEPEARTVAVSPRCVTG